MFRIFKLEVTRLEDNWIQQSFVLRYSIMTFLYRTKGQSIHAQQLCTLRSCNEDRSKFLRLDILTDLDT